MKKRIVLSAKAQKEIATMMGVTDRMVRNALSYGSNTALARRIRVIAIEKGGEVIGGAKLETRYHSDEKTNEMIQTYGGRLQIVTNLMDGQTVVYLDGEGPVVYNDLNIAEYTRLQERYMRKVDVQ